MKFRAYLEGTGIIVDVQEINYKYEEIVYEDGRYTEVADFKDIELLQSTSIEYVFEADIIKFEIYVKAQDGALEIEKEGTGYIYKEDDCMWVKTQSEIIPLWWLKHEEAHIKVLGNIYENKELLDFDTEI